MGATIKTPRVCKPIINYNKSVKEEENYFISKYYLYFSYFFCSVEILIKFHFKEYLNTYISLYITINL